MLAALEEAVDEAGVDVYHGNTHAFDMLLPWQEQSKEAKHRLCEEYERHMMNRDL